MKTNYWLVFGTMLSTSLLAQQITNVPAAGPVGAPAPMAPAVAPAVAPPSAPAAVKPAQKKAAPKKQAAKKAPAKKKAPAPELKTVPLVAGPAVVEANNVNVRGQASLKGEVLARVTKGQAVTVVQEITRNNSGPEEPSAWAKILLPTNAHVWVNSHFIDATNKTVVPKKLNLRGGPGENFSRLGTLQRGDAVKELANKGDWIQIEIPTNAYAFVAAQYLKQEAPAVTLPPAIVATETPATPATVTEPPLVATTTTEMSGATSPTAEAPILTTPPLAEVPAAPAVEEPPPKRIVQHEGIVRGMTSIQAPSHFELVSPDNGRTVDYLYTTSTNLDLRRYKGLRIVVTGEEGLDERWPNTPIITIQKIQVLEETSKPGK